MSNPAKDARDKIQAKWPGASVSARGRKSITHQHPSNPNKFASDYFIGPLHYGPGEDQEIETDWQAGELQDQPWLWKMVTNDFHAFAMPGNDEFDAGQIIRYVDPASGEEITFQPQQLQWSNDLDQIEAIEDPATVSGTVSGDELRWTAAYGAGIDFVWQAQTARVQKLIEVDAVTTIGPPAQFIIDGGNAYLKFSSIFQKSSGIEIWIDGVEWDEKSNNPQLTAGTVEFRDSGGLLFSMAQPWAAEHDAPEPSKINGELYYRKSAQNLFIEVRIPWSWLETAAYPILIDDSIDYQTAASGDDAVQTGTSVSITATEGNIDRTNEYYGMRWAGVTIPDGATIDAATIDVMIHHNSQDDPDVTIAFEDTGTPAVFTTAVNSISNRTPTTATVGWDDPDFGAATGAWASTATTLPELKTIVQELVDSYDYSSGLYMCSIWQGADNSGTRDISIRFYDYSGNVSGPKLHIEYTAGGGTLYYQSAAGTLTPAGAAVKEGQKPLAGALTSAGAIAKLTATSLAGTLTSAGVVAKGLYLSLAGTLTTSGAVAGVKTALKSLAGTLTSAGAITKETAKPLAGALTSAGAIVKTTAKPFAGALTSAGAVVKETATSLAGTLTTSGALAAAKQAAGLYYQAVAGTLTSAGAIVKTTAKPLAGTLSSAGTVAKGLYLSLAGTLTSAGAVVKETAKPLAGALTSAGTVAKQANKPLAGALTSAGAIVKTTAKPLAGALTSAGTVAKGLYLSLAGTLTTSGVVASVKNPVLSAIDLTLRARSMALNLVSRAFSLAVRSRSTDLTLQDREE